LDRAVEAAWPHGLDLGVDLAQLVFEPGQVLRKPPGPGFSVEGALALGDLGHGLVEWAGLVGKFARSLVGALRRRPIGTMHAHKLVDRKRERVAASVDGG